MVKKECEVIWNANNKTTLIAYGISKYIPKFKNKIELHLIIEEIIKYLGINLLRKVKHLYEKKPYSFTERKKQETYICVKIYRVKF